MEHLKIFEEFTVESETSSYEVPKFVIKPYPGDKGFELTRKRYHRFMWVLPNLGKGAIDKGENPPITEAAFDDTIDTHDWDAQNPAEISGMGQSNDFFATKTPGYTKTDTDLLSTDDIEDPDKRKARKLKKIKKFQDFIDDEEE